MSCKNDSNSIEKSAEKVLKSYLLDPESYKNIDIRLKDTTCISDTVLNSLNKIMTYEEIDYFIDFFKNESDDLNSLYEVRLKRDSLETVQSKLKNNPELDSILFISIDIKHKSKNRYGVEIINISTLKYDVPNSSFTLLNHELNEFEIYE